MHSVTNLMQHKQTNNDELFIEPGSHSIPFNVILPPVLPTSFENYFGSVKYCVQATIEIPW
jgi:hypothetical protein